MSGFEKWIRHLITELGLGTHGVVDETILLRDPVISQNLQQTF